MTKFKYMRDIIVNIFHFVLILSIILMLCFQYTYSRKVHNYHKISKGMNVDGVYEKLGTPNDISSNGIELIYTLSWIPYMPLGYIFIKNGMVDSTVITD